MYLDYYFGAVGLVAWLGTGIFLYGCLFAQDSLFEKWEARENGWIKEGNLGLNTYLVHDNTPPQEFIEAFNSRPLRKYRWAMWVVGLVGFVLFAFSTR